MVCYTYLPNSSQSDAASSQIFPHHQSSSSKENVENLMSKLKRMHAEYDNHLWVIRAKNSELKRQIDSQRLVSDGVEKRNAYLIDKMAALQSGGYRKKLLEDRLAPRIDRNDLRTINIHLNSEFEIIQYMYFDKNYMYPIFGSLDTKLESIPVGDRRSEHNDVVAAGQKALGFNATKDLCHGLQRLERTKGIQYELFFETSSNHVVEHVSVFRPFAPLQVVSREMYDKSTEWVNVVMPLKGRLESFSQFLATFMTIVRTDRNIFFTLVYFGSKGREEAKDMLESTAKEHNYTDFIVIEKEGNFTRGKGLLAGVETWRKGNVLLFFCDVDMYLKPHFFRKCRLNAAPSEKVYYPIVFSLYNPALVFSRSEIPPLEERLVVHRDYGFWRTFGFGMVCIYRSDFTFHRGFDGDINGWGWEDVQLYRKLLRTNLEVVRSPDPDIFHIWHEKICDPNLPPRQYDMCVGSKAAADGLMTRYGKLQENDKYLNTGQTSTLDRHP